MYILCNKCEIAEKNKIMTCSMGRMRIYEIWEEISVETC